MQKEGQVPSNGESGAEEPQDGSGAGIGAAMNAAASATRQATGRGMNMIQQGLRALTEISRPALEIMHDHGLQTADAVTQMSGACHKAAESTASDVQALTAAYMQLGCGMQEAQHAWTDMGRRSMDRMVQWQQAVLGCRSAADLAQVQQSFFCDTIGFMVEAGAELLQIRIGIAQSAVEPLRNRVRQQRR